MTGLLASCGVWLEDEIQQSSDPAAHADGIITTMQREKIGWVATNCAINGATLALDLLLDAASRHGYGACGYWNQNLEVDDFLRSGDFDGAQLMIANVESRNEEAKWSTQAIDLLAKDWPNYHAAVCWTEAAWGKHPDGTYRSDLASRWHDGIVSMPEAIQSENPDATIMNMLHVNGEFGFAKNQTSTVVYLTRGYAAANYSDKINYTPGGCWSAFRYGDIDPADWAEMRNWDRPSDIPEPPPTPEPDMPRGAAKSAYDAMDHWFNSTAAGPAWRTGNPGEWQKVQDYRAAPPGTPAPAVNTKIGLMLVSILEAAKWAAGEHE